MTVVTGGNGELLAHVGEGTRELVLATLRAHSAALDDSASHELTAEAGERRLAYAASIRVLQRQLEDTSGPAVLAGPASLVAEVVRDTAVQAAHELDSLLEALAASPDRLSDDMVTELRARTQAAGACIEALIACESSRGGA